MSSFGMVKYIYPLFQTLVIKNPLTDMNIVLHTRQNSNLYLLTL